MAMSPEERAELKSMFRAECDDHLGALNGLLMALEHAPTDSETLNETFRRMHSVKGAARMVGFAGIEAVAHALEALLAKVRGGSQSLGPAMLALIFHGIDAITDLMAAGTGTSAEEPTVQEMLVRVAGLPN